MSTSATLPSSQLCAGSAGSSESGRSAARSPWHSHLSGNSAAIVCMPLGRLLNGKYTPEMNCSTRYGRFSTAAALRLERGTLLTAMPSMVQVATPSRKTQVKVSQRAPVLGQLEPVERDADAEQDGDLDRRDDQAGQRLAREIGALGHRRARPAA